MNLPYAKNLEQTRERIRKICLRLDRDPGQVMLVAVSKTVGIDAVESLIEAGHYDFGENRIREFLEKHTALGEKARFHFIGHLQTNKVKDVVGRAVLIHSVDSLRLLAAIQLEARKKQVVQDILLQADISGEESKYGAGRKEILEMIQANEQNSSVRIRGLMTMAPYRENPEEIRWVFQKLQDLLIDIRNKPFYNTTMEYASMGMSNDFEIAVEEGSNVVRIGSSIFG